jgi:hypothetical protein
MLSSSAISQVDTDSDGILDGVDNCIDKYNPFQEDTDFDGFGNLCDGDLNNDFITNAQDLGLFKSSFFGNSTNWEHADMNSDGVVNSLDLGLFKASFFSPPGPSGWEILNLTWTAPTLNDDDSILDNLAGFNIYWNNSAGVSQNNYLGTEQVPGDQEGAEYNYIVTVVPGEYHIVATAFNSEDPYDESGDSNAIIKSCKIINPNPPPSGGGIILDFSIISTSSFGSQDNSSNVTVSPDGATITIADNTWRKTDTTYTIVSETVLQFTFDSSVRGEIHGIGFQPDEALRPDRIFKLWGTQAWGIADFNYADNGPELFTIPIGQYYQGNNMYLVFANDDDANVGSNSSFTDVGISGGPGPKRTCEL